MEAEREKEKKEIAALRNLVTCFNEKVKKFEEQLESNSEDTSTTKAMVSDMLSSIPQVSSIEERFSGIEDRIDEYEYSRSSGETPSNVSNFEIRMNELEENVQEIRSQVNVQCTQPVSHDVISNMSEPSCSTGYPDLTHLAEVANEL